MGSKLAGLFLVLFGLLAMSAGAEARGGEDVAMYELVLSGPTWAFE